MTRPDLLQTLERAEQVIRWMPDVQDQFAQEPSRPAQVPEGPLQVGVDLGTAYLVLVVLDQNQQPIAGEYQFAQVARDGLVVDFIGAVDRLTAMKRRVEGRLGCELTHASSGYPPGVPQVEVRATANVVEAAGFHCTGLVDEPSAANALHRVAERRYRGCRRRNDRDRHPARWARWSTPPTNLPAGRTSRW